MIKKLFFSLFSLLLGNDLIARLAQFQNEQVGGTIVSSSTSSLTSTNDLGNSGSSTSGRNTILERVQQDLTASRILSSSGVNKRNGNEQVEVTAALQSASARVTGSNFFTTNHMVDLPLDHPMTVGMYPSSEPQFFWLDKFYEAQNEN